ncbi:uncharacterized protein LOC143212291 [Lasioglossum baleicum]|uniref:uncharacterized protein LOC143212291 n=1 Tax=Lasioglossum baleicum TaxID=434251 RepID=UPI003FCD1F17
MEHTRLPQILISKRGYITKINGIRDTVNSLEESFMVSRSLEAEQWLKHTTLRTKSKLVAEDLKKANKRNKNMLNLFRQSVTDVRLGNEIALPESLKKEVQRNWHQKYDSLLMQNDKLKKELATANRFLKEKCAEVDNLQQKMLALGDRLAESNGAVENVCRKYLRLKKRKDEQETLLRGSIETLQVEAKSISGSRLRNNCIGPAISNKDTLLAQETRRSDRLARENSLLRVLLQEARRDGRVGVASIERTRS